MITCDKNGSKSPRAYEILTAIIEHFFNTQFDNRICQPMWIPHYTWSAIWEDTYSKLSGKYVFLFQKGSKIRLI